MHIDKLIAVFFFGIGLLGALFPKHLATEAISVREWLGLPSPSLKTMAWGYRIGGIAFVIWGALVILGVIHIRR